MSTNESGLSTQILEKSLTDRITREKFDGVDIVETRIQNAFSVAMNSSFVPKIKLAITSKNASSGQNIASIEDNSELEEEIGIITPFVNTSNRNDINHEFNLNVETQEFNLNEES